MRLVSDTHIDYIVTIQLNLYCMSDAFIDCLNVQCTQCTPCNMGVQPTTWLVERPLSYIHPHAPTGSTTMSRIV